MTYVEITYAEYYVLYTVSVNDSCYYLPWSAFTEKDPQKQTYIPVLLSLFFAVNNMVKTLFSTSFPKWLQT
jgi:hypothetical protein